MKILQIWLKKISDQKGNMNVLRGTKKKNECDDNFSKGDQLSEPLLQDFIYGIDECVGPDGDVLNMAEKSDQKRNMDEMYGTGKKSECDDSLCKGDHHSELEDFTYGTDECVGTDEDVLNMSEETSDQKGNMDEMQGTGKKNRCDESLFNGDHLSELEDFTYGIDECIGTDEDVCNMSEKSDRKGNMDDMQGTGEKSKWYDNLCEWDHSSEPDDFTCGIDECVGTDDIAEKPSDQNGSMDEMQGTGKKSEWYDNLYEGGHLSELEDFTYGIDECVGTDEDVFNMTEETSDQKENTVETMSKGDHKAGAKLVDLQAEMAKDCKAMGDKGSSSSFITRSCCLNCYEASLKLCERSPVKFSSKQLMLHEGDLDFCRVINSLGQDQQKRLTHILDLQCCSVVLEKKIKEIENLLPQEEDTDWNQDIQEPENNQKKQQTQIMDLCYNMVYLGAKIRKLEGDILKQHDLFDTITTLKRSVADLREAMNKAIQEKDKAESCLKSVEEALANTKSCLQDCEAERSALILQLTKCKVDVGTLQEKLQEEVEQKTKYMSHCVELDSILQRKEQEMQELITVKNKLEQKVSDTTSALQKINDEKDSLEKHAESLQAALQRQKDEREAEKKELVGKYDKLAAQIKTLQVQSENEQAEMEQMQQQIHAFRMEKGDLQQQIAKSKNENHLLQAESAQWKEKHEQIRESQTLKEKMQNQIIKGLRYKLRLQQEEMRTKEEILAWKMHILGRLHLDMKSVHSDLSTRSLYTEENHVNSHHIQKVSNLLSKVCSLLALTEGFLTCQVMQNSPFSTSLPSN